MSLFFLLKSGKSFTATYQIANDSVSSECPSGQACDLIYTFLSTGGIQETIDLGVGGTSVVPSTITPWSDDPAEDGTGKWVRITHLSGTNRRNTTPAETTWTQLTSNVNFTFQRAAETGPYSDNSSYTIDLSIDGSTVHDTMTLSINLSNVGP